MKRLKIIICLMMLVLTGCQEKSPEDDNWIANFVESHVGDLKGYKIDAVYYYEGDHLRTDEIKIGKGKALKIIISYRDIFKDPNHHELVSVFNEEGYDEVMQGYIYGENEDVLLGVDHVDVYDSNRPIKYIKVMSDQEIKEINQRLYR